MPRGIIAETGAGWRKGKYVGSERSTELRILTAGAPKHGEVWEPWEDEFVLDPGGLTEEQLCKFLQRSMQAVQSRRWVLTKQMHVPDEWRGLDEQEW